MAKAILLLLLALLLLLLAALARAALGRARNEARARGGRVIDAPYRVLRPRDARTESPSREPRGR